MLEQIDKLMKRSEFHRTAKESEFLASIRQQYVIKGDLSPGQMQWFTSLENKYSPDKIEAEALWQKNFDESKRKVALQVANYYYNNPPYYSGYVAKILASPDTFVLSMADWNRLCNNKYSLRVREMYEQELKFDQGSLVQIRKTNRLDLANYNREGNRLTRLSTRKLADKPAVILKQDAAPVVRAAKGSRRYQILIVGDSGPILAHESDLKAARKKKNVKKN